MLVFEGVQVFRSGSDEEYIKAVKEAPDEACVRNIDRNVGLTRDHRIDCRYIQAPIHAGKGLTQWYEKIVASSWQELERYVLEHPDLGGPPHKCSACNPG